MNKKIFTLLAGSLMLFMAVFTTNAQSRPWVGDTVRTLQTTGNGAYHLMITSVGDSVFTGPNATSQVFLTMDSIGFVNYERWDTNTSVSYRDLREALWCVTVDCPNMGQVPVYTFTNKEYGVNLAVLDGNFSRTITTLSEFDGSPIQRQMVYSSTGDLYRYNKGVYSTGDQEDWWFSRVFENALETDTYLRIETDDPDYFLTFASNVSDVSPATLDSLILVKVHQRDFNPTSAFAQTNLVRFTLVTAAPRVLNASDFNTKLGEQAAGMTQLIFNEAVTVGENVLAQPLWAENAGGSGVGQYMYLRTAISGGNYVYVTDKLDEYHNDYGTYYPTIRTGATQGNGSDQFRMVYYPSEDSLIINVYQINDHPLDGTRADLGSYNLGTNNLYNAEIWNYLLVKYQDLSVGDGQVITIGNRPTDVRISFGIRECGTYETNRTTVESDLYTIQDVDGRYLVVPLDAGDFTPQWKKLTTLTQGGANETLEVALKTPAYQWFVTKVDTASGTSRIHLTNREFDFIRLEYVQIYTTPTKFYVHWHLLTDDLNPDATYVVDGTNFVSVDGFNVVRDDPDAAAKKLELIGKYGTGTTRYTQFANHQVQDWMWHMPEDLMQKLYRTSPFLGYKAILPDTLNYFGYSFNYLHNYSDEFYLSVSEREKNSSSDTTLFVDEQKTYFQLLLPDSLLSYGREKYGLGHGTNSIYARYDKSDIAPLERYYYNFKVNDYYNFLWNDNFLVIDYAARYAYTDEANANARELNKTKFYLRFTYEKNNQEYYALLDRIDKSNFDYLTTINRDLSITREIKPYDESHNGFSSNGFGVLMATVDDMNKFVTPRVKTGSATVSTFAIGQMQEELYRRFNTSLEECGRGEEGDEPRILKFYRYNNPFAEYLFEDFQSSSYAVPGSGIGFLGNENKFECSTDKGHWHADHNYAIYVDTAYVNRGTGHIKPQYMLVMNPSIEAGGRGCNVCGDSIDLKPYVYGRYLRNMTDRAHVNGNPQGAILDANYIWDGTWDRLAFVPAIHAGDSLYILNGTPISNLYAEDADGQQYLNFALMEDYPNIEVVDLGNNFHKDEVFSMRFANRQRNNLGIPIEEAGKQFFIESETTNRDYTQGRMIAPMHGGWIKLQNNVPVISRGSFTDLILEAEIFDVECAGVNELPTNNDDIALDNVTVVAGNGTVTILNAIGKRVVISNILGQTIANEVLTSDNATIPAAKGVVVVAVEGEDAVKTIVK